MATERSSGSLPCHRIWPMVWTFRMRGLGPPHPGKRQRPYFSRRQLIDPLVSTVLDSASTSKPRLSRYFSVSTEPLPTIETP